MPEYEPRSRPDTGCIFTLFELLFFLFVWLFQRGFKKVMKKKKTGRPNYVRNMWRDTYTVAENGWRYEMRIERGRLVYRAKGSNKRYSYAQIKKS